MREAWNKGRIHFDFNEENNIWEIMDFCIFFNLIIFLEIKNIFIIPKIKLNNIINKILNSN